MALPRALRAALLAPYLAALYPLLTLRRAAAALRPRHGWRTWVTPQLLLGGFLLPGDVEALRRLGVRAVVNVSHELCDPVEALRSAGIDYLRVPSWDTCAPTLEAADRGVRFIAAKVTAGQRVYVHCASGVGRSVALTLCYLAIHEGIPIEEGLGRLKRLRPRVAMRPRQLAFVERFVAWQRRRARPDAGGPT